MEHFDSNLDLQQQQQQQERRPPIYNAEDYVLGLKKFCKLTGKDCWKKNYQNSDENFNNEKFFDLLQTLTYLDKALKIKKNFKCTVQIRSFSSKLDF